MYLNPGTELKLSEYASQSPGSLGISDLVGLSIAELDTKEQTSVDEEEKICTKIQNLTSEWRSQAAQTVRIRQAKQYLRTMPADHTANRWETDQHDNHEISNKVYKFSWRVYERTRWSSTEQKSITVAWELTWSLTFNTPKNPDMTGRGWKIAGQDRKFFKDAASMDKYLQGRIAAYAHLFTEISPPIPKSDQRRFCVNGVLLPGYTVENPDAIKPDEAAVDKLLALLGDDELGCEVTPPAPQPEPKSPQEIWAKHRKPRPGPSRRGSAPAR